MQIQKPAFITTSALEKCDVIRSFDKLTGLLNQKTQEPLAFDTTDDITELQNAGIKSAIVIDIVVKGEAGFVGRELLFVCNRNKPAIGTRVYLSYDYLFCNIVRLVLQLYISERFYSAYKRYKNARERYLDAKLVSSLILVGETALNLLDEYRRYSAVPPTVVIYDCLDSYIGLFNTKQISENKLESVLNECKQWLPQEQIGQNSRLDLIRHALARGYFILGTERENGWRTGKSLLGT